MTTVCLFVCLLELQSEMISLSLRRLAFTTDLFQSLPLAVFLVEVKIGGVTFKKEMLATSNKELISKGGANFCTQLYVYTSFYQYTGVPSALMVKSNALMGHLQSV